MATYKVSPPLLSLWGAFSNQEEIKCEQKRFYFLHGGRGGGKSVGVADFLIERSRLETCRILCGREVQNSIKESVYSLIESSIHAHNLGGEFEFTLTEIRHKRSQSTFHFTGLREHTSDTIKGFQGIKYCWIEEAQSISQKSLKILIPTIRLEHSSFIFTYNRMRENDPVHELMRREITSPYEKYGVGDYTWDQSEGKDAICVWMNYESNPYFPNVLLSEMQKEKEEDPAAYSHIWRGEPQGQNQDSIIARSEIDEACERQVSQDGQVVAGVDVARFGNDSTVFFKRKGLQVIKYLTITKSDIVSTGEKLIDFMDGDTSAEIRIDDSGVGGGLTDYMKAKGYNAIPIVFNQSPKNPDKYDMAISEMWFEFKDTIKDAGIPDIKELKEELAERKYIFDKSQRRSIEPKKDFKKRIGRSPDYADALLLCFYSMYTSFADLPELEFG